MDAVQELIAGLRSLRELVAGLPRQQVANWSRHDGKGFPVLSGSLKREFDRLDAKVRIACRAISLSPPDAGAIHADVRIRGFTGLPMVWAWPGSDEGFVLEDEWIDRIEWLEANAEATSESETEVEGDRLALAEKAWKSAKRSDPCLTQKAFVEGWNRKQTVAGMRLEAGAFRARLSRSRSKQKRTPQRAQKKL